MNDVSGMDATPHQNIKEDGRVCTHTHLGQLLLSPLAMEVLLFDASPPLQLRSMALQLCTSQLYTNRLGDGRDDRRTVVLGPEISC
jgi:hypothetical protein